MDITNDEARAKKLVNGNEVFIGRRIIAENMKREMPSFVQYLKGSYRHVIACAPADSQIPLSDLAAIEAAMTEGIRQDGWLTTELQACSATMLHGVGYLFVIPSLKTGINTEVAYLATPDVIIPRNLQQFQAAPMIGIRYHITSSEFSEWAEQYKWNTDAVRAVRDSLSDADKTTKNIPVYLVMYRDNAPGSPIKRFWYTDQPEHMLSTQPEPLFSGRMQKGPTGAPEPAPETVYPLFPFYYNITENPVIVERKGRAHEDRHDQEALTMGITSYVNSMIRSSELYMAFDDGGGPVESTEVAQTDVVIKPGVVIKRPVKFFTPPAPDSNALATLQYLKSDNAAAAGHTDFAVQNRQDSRKTAAEIKSATATATEHQTVPLTFFALCYAELLRFRWDIVRANVAAGVNTTFLAQNPVREKLDTVYLKPAGDIDFIARQEKLQKFVQFFSLYAQTPLAQFFQQKILELAFPDEYPQMAPLLTDPTRQLGEAMLQVLENLPPGTIPPAQAQQIAQLTQTARQVYGSNPSPGMAPAPNNPSPSAPSPKPQ